MAYPTLTLEHGNVRAEVVPQRGCLVARLRVDGVEVLYLDRATVDDPEQSVRGGIPLLFPFAGRLKDDRLLDAGTSLRQHGFARHMAWSLTESRPGQLRFSLADTEQTRAVYPHAFTADHVLTVLPRGLQMELVVVNRGSAPLPLSPGWHPYFRCPSAQKPRIRTDVPGLDPARFLPDAEFDFGVPAPADGRAAFDLPGLGRLRLTHSAQMRFLQCWSLPGRDFVCLEPFWGPNDTLNTPLRLQLPAGAGHTLCLRIEVDA
ncbi:MAG: aldose epimerase [Deltaproteobacteria bacterium]|nr:aldose epimerase [Deltaproteobacteria bacterium]